jgi:hypothetical protein
MLCQGPAPVPVAIDRCQELRDSSTDQPLLEAVIDSALFALFAMAGRSDEAHQYSRRSSAILDEFPYSALGQLSRNAAEAELLLGDAAAAERHLLASWDRAQRRGHTSLGGVETALGLALLCSDQGRWQETEQWLVRARQDPPAPPRTRLWFLRLDATARLIAHRGELEEALVLARQPTELTDDSDRLNQRAQAWLTLAEILRTARRIGEADAAHASAIALYERKGNVAAAGRVRAAESARSG